VIKVGGSPSLRTASANVHGKAPSPGLPISRGDLLDGARIELPDGAELTLQATASGREIGLRGPARAEVCPEGEEEMRLSWGTVRGFLGPGVRPGAEVWVATPLGVIRFNDANLEIEVGSPVAKRLSVRVASGRAVFVPVSAMLTGEPGPKSQSEVPIGTGAPFVVERPDSTPFRLAQDLGAACTREADRVEQGARAVLASQGGALGERAAQYVQARRSAHMVCASARAAAALDPTKAEGSFWAELEKAEQKWKSPLPSAAVAGE
jgi:hypothetical protein